MRRGDLAGAEPLMREALALYGNATGGEYPRTQVARLALADVLVKRGCFVEAEPLILDWFEGTERAATARSAEIAPASARRVLRFYLAWRKAQPSPERRAVEANWRSRVTDETAKSKRQPLESAPSQ